MTGAWLFIDYQNVHLSAWESFAPYGTEKKDAQIHPVAFANQVRKKRTEAGLQDIEIERILLFRGTPNPRREGKLSSVVSKQHQAWAQDPRLQLHTRPLRYLRSWPETKAEEKGIDVLLAISLVRAAIEESADLLLVASRDTDLLPAIELAHAVKPGSVEIVTWFGQTELTCDGVSTHALGEAAYRASRDPRDYGATIRRR